LACTIDTSFLYFSTDGVWEPLGGGAGSNPGWVWVYSKGDLPAAVAGVITLTAFSTYFFLTNVDLTGDRLVLGDSTVLAGASSENAGIKSTGLTGTAMITSTHSCPMRDITLEADVALDLNAIDSDQALDWRAVNLSNCPTMGTIAGYGNTIFTDCAILSSANLTFDGTISTVGFDGTVFVGIASQTTIILPATLTLARRFRINHSAIVSFGGATGISVDALTTIPAEGFILRDVNFSGGATYVSGLTEESLKVLWVDCVGLPNSSTAGSLYMENNASATTIAASMTPVKVAGVTVAGFERKLSHSSNRLTYNGAISRVFVVSASSDSEAANGKQFQFMLYKNGIALPGSSASVTTSGTKPEHAGIHSMVSLVTGDYVEVWVQNLSDTTNVVVKNMHIVAHSVP
jgi:hypothetical protein